MIKWSASRQKGIIPWGRKSRKNKRNSLLSCSLKQNFVPLDNVFALCKEDVPNLTHPLFLMTQRKKNLLFLCGNKKKS